MSNEHKQSIYLTDSMLNEIRGEAARQDRSISWVMRKAWKLARREILSAPGVNDPIGSSNP